MIDEDIKLWCYIINYENRLVFLFEFVYVIVYILVFVFGVFFIIY